MKKVWLAFGLVVALGMGAVAQADTVLMHEGRHGSYKYEVALYRFDPQQGTAGLQLEFAEYVTNWDSIGQTRNVEIVSAAVPGLSYDAAASQLVYAGEKGGKAVCAKVTERTGFLGRKKWVITPTGECLVRAERAGDLTKVYFETR